eukprot:TRINITY_DN48890_c0_g1_i1.p1 TRINITY_DN48890_c0_g1~~TRINITY_DN48890_c0_g1_i1.p1  ORF type:complete len:175 (-),score=2.86 TRINITY_DN48890_c0_g1_i1:5-502(-)
MLRLPVDVLGRIFHCVGPSGHALMCCSSDMYECLQQFAPHVCGAASSLHLRTLQPQCVPLITHDVPAGCSIWQVVVDWQQPWPGNLPAQSAHASLVVEKPGSHAYLQRELCVTDSQIVYRSQHPLIHSLNECRPCRLVLYVCPDYLGNSWDSGRAAFRVYFVRDL